MATSLSSGGATTGSPAPHPPSGGWTAGRIIALVTGSILALVSIGLLAGAGALLWADQTQRHGGYLTSSTATYTTSGHALASDTVNLHGGRDWLGILLGQVRIRATAADPAKPVFVAIGPAAAVTRYLTGVQYTSVTAFGSPRGATTSHPGTAVPPPPATTGIWSVQASGHGTQTILWALRSV